MAKRNFVDLIVPGINHENARWSADHLRARLLNKVWLCLLFSLYVCTTLHEYYTLDITLSYEPTLHGYLYVSRLI